MTMTKSVLIIYTGGTIGMVNDPATGALCPFDFEQIAKAVPEIREFGFSINSYGSVYYNDDRVFNPKAIETIPVYLLDFTTENIMFGYNQIENGENNYLFRDSFLKKRL